MKFDKYIIKFKREDNDAKMPERATDGSAAYDAFIPRNTKVAWGRQVIPLGWSLEMPLFISLDCRSRSGYSAKGLLVYDKNGDELRIDADVHLGLIDSDYRNEIGAILQVRDRSVLLMDLYLKKHQAVGQLKFNYVPNTELIEVESLCLTNRKGGFGKMNGE